ncbi:MAG TPA: hypothetical protein VF111_09360 [Thermoanaerobaculia bacterium]
MRILRSAVLTLGLSLLLAGSALAQEVQSDGGPALVQTDTYCNFYGPCESTFVEHDGFYNQCGWCPEDWCNYWPNLENTCCIEQWECCGYWDDWNHWRLVMTNTGYDLLCEPQ